MYYICFVVIRYKNKDMKQKTDIEKKSIMMGFMASKTFRAQVEEQAKINGVPASKFIRDAIQAKIEYQRALEIEGRKEMKR